MQIILRLTSLLLALSLPAVASAHGLLIKPEHHGDTIGGVVYYSNGELAVGESVELLDLSTPNAKAVPGVTDNDGKFSFPVTANNRYRISAYAGEGHGVDVEMEAVANARPQLVDNDAANQETSWMPPAWAVIGGILLASLVPVLISRRRQAATRA